MTDLVRNVNKYHQTSPNVSTPLTQIALIGTVKLHGTHGDILINEDNSITLQSRNTTNLTPEKVNWAFAAFAAFAPSRIPSILALKDKYYSTFRSLNPATPIDPSRPLIFAGEWIGPGIQKGVAISSLPTKVFVICCVSINGDWLPNDGPYADLHAEEDGIYNISRAGFYHHSLSLTDTASSAQTLQDLANSIENSCPFAKTFNIDGGGEGLVTAKVSKGGPNREVKEKAAPLAEKVTSENRLEQGWDFLRETYVERGVKSLGKFMQWVIGNVEKEERREIEGEGVEWKAVKKEVEGRARKWYLRKVEGEKGGNEVKTMVDMNGETKARQETSSRERTK
ncbi:hypothetical protein MMC14_006538 [Varicellaria rhodocarpa]|nr:hypothetical protein [Varicellaria rhodocarpa]